MKECKEARKLMNEFDEYESNFFDFPEKREKIKKELWERRNEPATLFNKLNEQLVIAGFPKETVIGRELPLYEGKQLLLDFNLQYPEVLNENVFDGVTDFDEFYDEIFWLVNRINEMAFKLEEHYKGNKL